MATATAPKQERPQQQLIAEGINLIGMLSCDLVRKLERLDTELREKLFRTSLLRVIQKNILIPSPNGLKD